MFYYVEPSSVFLKPSLLKPGLESSVIQPMVFTAVGSLARRLTVFADIAKMCLLVNISVFMVNIYVTIHLVA